MSKFSSFDTENCILIIENDSKLYQFRKNFLDYHSFAFFYKKFPELYKFVNFSEVDFSEVFQYTQDPEN